MSHSSTELTWFCLCLFFLPVCLIAWGEELIYFFFSFTTIKGKEEDVPSHEERTLRKDSSVNDE